MAAPAPAATGATGARHRRGHGRQGMRAMWPLLLLSLGALLLFHTAAAASVRGKTAPMVCLDLGVLARFPRSPDLPVEELSELTTGKSCARTAVFQGLMGSLEQRVQGLAAAAIDCVTTEVDEERIAVHASVRLCSKGAGDKAPTKAEITTWEVDVRSQLQRLLGSGHRDGRGCALRYRTAVAACGSIQLTKPYVLPGPDSSSQFRYKAAELWAEPGLTSTTSHVLVKLRAKNEGTIPLHFFAATVKSLDEPGTTRAMFLSPVDASPLMPSQERAVTFRAEAVGAVSFADGSDFGLYFAHTAPRFHVLEGTLQGTKLKIKERSKAAQKLKSEIVDRSADGLANTSGSGAYFAAFPFSIWRLFSIGIVVAVGAFATLFMRRRSARVQWSRALECMTLSRLRHKGPSKTTEMVTKRAAYEPEESTAEDGSDMAESDSLLDGTEPKSTPTWPMSKRREIMPAITMKWKKPTLSIRRTLNLDANARLNPKRFENMWEEFIERHSSSFHAEHRLDANELVSAMESAGIACMASGIVDGVEKYVLYTKQKDTNDYFFVSIDILQASRHATVSIRTGVDTHDTLIDDFVALVSPKLEALLKGT